MRLIRVLVLIVVPARAQQNPTVEVARWELHEFSATGRPRTAVLPKSRSACACPADRSVFHWITRSQRETEQIRRTSRTGFSIVGRWCVAKNRTNPPDKPGGIGTGVSRLLSATLVVRFSFMTGSNAVAFDLPSNDRETTNVLEFKENSPPQTNAMGCS
jgi:hypothetical protein